MNKLLFLLFIHFCKGFAHKTYIYKNIAKSLVIHQKLVIDLVVEPYYHCKMSCVALILVAE